MNAGLIKELKEEADNIEAGEFLTEEEFEKKHNIQILADEKLLAEDWLSPEDEEAWRYL